MVKNMFDLEKKKNMLNNYAVLCDVWNNEGHTKRRVKCLFNSTNVHVLHIKYEKNFWKFLL